MHKKLNFKLIFLLLLLIQQLLNAQLENTPCPKFRINNQNTGLSSYGATPPQSIKSKNIVTNWNTLTTALRIESSPVIGSYGRIYVGGSLGFGGLYCFNSDDGTILWQFPITAGTRSTPAVGKNGKVYIGGWDSYLYCINTNGTLNWKSKTQLNEIASSPNIGSDGKIYSGSQNEYALYCFKTNGKTNWMSPTGNTVISSPAIGYNGNIYVGSQDGYLYCFKTNGKTNWRTFGGGSLVSAPAIGSDGKIYFGSANGYLYSLYTNGLINWQINIGTLWSSPAIGSDGKIYIGSEDHNLYCINPDGSLNWKVLTGDIIRSSPVIGSDNKIYVGSWDKYLYCFNTNGTTNWRVPTGARIHSSPAIDNKGNIYIGCTDGDPRIYCFYVLPDPEIIECHAKSSIEMDLVWKKINNVTSYSLFRSMNTNLQSAIKIGGTNTTNYSDGGLLPGITYYYWVKGYTSKRSTDYSSPASAVTLSLILSSQITTLDPSIGKFFRRNGKIRGIAKLEGTGNDVLDHIIIRIKNVNQNTYWDGSKWSSSSNSFLIPQGKETWEYNCHNITWDYGKPYSVQSWAIAENEIISDSIDKRDFIPVYELPEYSFVNYPNPFDPNKENTCIEYLLLNRQDTKLSIMGINGELVKEWSFKSGNEGGKEGLNRIYWDGKNGKGYKAANGIYFCSLNNNERDNIIKIMVLK